MDVLVCTQPHEPLCHERVDALRNALPLVDFYHFDQAIEQDPEAPGFWDLWKGVLDNYISIPSETVIVASETYGKKVAEIMGARFIPYDIDRSLNTTRATDVRAIPFAMFDQILPEFRKHLQTKVTIFGAESTGKTTLAKDIAAYMHMPWVFEWARPFLNYTVNEITVQSMNDIWMGQYALQQQMSQSPYPVVIQDTDLYSTIGYWELPHWQQILGACPLDLKRDASWLQSDLYLITRSDIPFEPDPLRYGGDHREGSDAYWISVCEKYKLPYFVLGSVIREERCEEAVDLIQGKMVGKLAQIDFDRKSGAILTG